MRGIRRSIGARRSTGLRKSGHPYVRRTKTKTGHKLQVVRRFK